ncbi:ankyrin repeat domain-containing protein [Treponema zioleckii]|uniref:ankyrin repeat domain-containing protein n=1 Tax=Treponema zioleckii TaxID=331680 RepID=UPI00168AFB91|nr:ankyrin repeat domain-containing protein [Treponema zioleckii]
MGAPLDADFSILFEIIGWLLFFGLTALVSGVILIFASGTVKTVARIVFGLSFCLPLGLMIIGGIFSSISDSFSEWKEARNFKKELTPLVRAVEKNNVRKVRKLLKKGQNPNETSKEFSALSLACLDDENDKSNKIITLLLDSGADANFVPLDEQTGKPVLFTKSIFAKKRNQASSAYLRIQASPLAFAIQGNRYSAVKNLISHGVDFSGSENKDSDCVQPIQLALHNDDYEKMTLLLLENGVKPAHMFCSYTHPDRTLIMELFEKKEMKSLEANVSILKKLIEFGFDLNAGDYWQQTAVHYAADAISRGTSPFALQLASVLLEYSPDVNKFNYYGNTPLLEAVAHEEKIENILSAVELLCSHGADITLKNKNEMIALEVFQSYFPEPRPNFTPNEVKKYHRIIELLTPKTAEISEIQKIEPPVAKSIDKSIAKSVTKKELNQKVKPAEKKDVEKVAEKDSERNISSIIENTEKVEVQTAKVPEKSTFQEEAHVELFDMTDNW